MLRERSDRRTLFFVGMYYASLVGLWVLDPAWPVKALWIVLLCWQSWQCAIITHNTIHCPVFVKRWMNRVFQVVLTCSYGHPVSAYVPGHNLSHHMYTQQDRDVMRTTKVRFRWNLLNGLAFFPTVGLSIAKNDKAFIAQMKAVRPRWYRQLILEAVVFAAVSIGLLLLDWQKFLLVWWLPHMAAAFGIISINYLQHDGCDQDHPYNHSRNFVGRVFNWLVLNNGYHGVHHDDPGLHWSKLREVHERDVAPHIHPALDQRSILLYMWRTFVWPGRRVRYDGQAVDLGPDLRDVSWVPEHGLPERVSLGAEG